MATYRRADILKAYSVYFNQYPPEAADKQLNTFYRIKEAYREKGEFIYLPNHFALLDTENAREIYSLLCQAKGTEEYEVMQLIEDYKLRPIEDISLVDFAEQGNYPQCVAEYIEKNFSFDLTLQKKLLYLVNL